MTLKEAGSAVTIVLWVAFALSALFSILLFSGVGLKLIAGFNTADKQEQGKFDKKRLSLVFGGGIAVISLFLLLMASAASILPFYCVYILQAILILDIIVMLILANTVCKKG